MRRARTLAAIAGLLGLAALAGAAETTGPGRVAVAGVFPTGYVGCLARFGMPRDILFDAQLSDAKVLSRYQVVIIAGVPDDDSVTAAINAYLAQGGRVLVDYSSQGRAIPGVMAAERRGGNTAQDVGLFGAVGMSRSGIRLTPNSPLGPLEPNTDEGSRTAGQRGMGVVPDTSKLQQPVVLAEFTSSLGRGISGNGAEALRQWREAIRAGNDPRESGSAAPAIVMGQRGPGRVLLCGQPVGLATSLMGSDFDSLILAMMRVISDGRILPQLEPEGPHLGRKQSLRSEHEPDAAGEEAVVATDRPDGPGARGSLPADSKKLAAEQPDEFNVTGKLAAATGEVLLHYWNSGNFVKVALSPTAAVVTRVTNGEATSLGGAALGLPAGTPFTLKERNDKLLLTVGSAYMDTSLSGVQKGALGARGLSDLDFLQTESVYFADDFMRTSDQSGGWETSGGRWETAPVQNPDMGANPFSYKVDASAGPAIALQGSAAWDEYKYSCSVRPGGTGGTVGLGWYAADAGNMYLFRAKVLTDPRPATDGFQLVKLVDGKENLLATLNGGLVAGQWYKVTVKTQGPWVGVFVDPIGDDAKDRKEHRLFAAKDTTFSHGRIALLADRATARFDDVEVESWTVASQEGEELKGKVPDYAGIIDVDSWAGPATVWEPDPSTTGLFWRRNSFFGDLDLRFDLPKVPDGSQATLLLDGDGSSANSGYALTVQHAAAAEKVELRHNGQVVDSRSLPHAGDKLSFTLARSGSKITGSLNDKAVVSTDGGPKPGGGRLAFATTGFKPKVSGISLWSRNLRDYTFDAAPIDWWVGSGSWDVTNRWSCTPDWSWFGGVADGIAAIWNKQEFDGDQVVDYYAGPKMMGVPIGVARGAKERTGDLNVVLCGDGKSVKSGYSFVVGGEPRGEYADFDPAVASHLAGGGAYILRNGKLMAEEKSFRFFTRAHNRWANVRAEKHGSRVELYVDGQLVVGYTDPDPLPGGYTGIWTQNNGIMVPRVTIGFEHLGDGCLSLLK